MEKREREGAATFGLESGKQFFPRNESRSPRGPRSFFRSRFSICPPRKRFNPLRSAVLVVASSFARR